MHRLVLIRFVIIVTTIVQTYSFALNYLTLTKTKISNSQLHKFPLLKASVGQSEQSKPSQLKNVDTLPRVGFLVSAGCMAASTLKEITSSQRTDFFLDIGASTIFSVSSYLVSSAAQRKRLDGSTFKILNVGLMTTATICSLTLARRGSLQSLRSMSFILSFISGYVVLAKYKLPQLKLKISRLVCAYMISAFLGFSQGLLSLSRDFCSQVAWINVFLLPSVFVALSGAASAGPKRLSSDTYKLLNAASLFLTLTTICNFLGDPNSFKGLWDTVAFVTMTLAQGASAGVGLFTGLFYNGDTPSIA